MNATYQCLQACTWNGGREKAPAAMCCRVAVVEDGGTIEVWGDGTAVRVFTLRDGIAKTYPWIKEQSEQAIAPGRRSSRRRSVGGPP